MGSKFFKIFTSKNMPPSWRKDWRKKILNMKSSTTSTNSTHSGTTPHAQVPSQHLVAHVTLVHVKSFSPSISPKLRGGLEPTQARYLSYGNRRPYQLSYSGLALGIILAIIFCIFHLWR